MGAPASAATPVRRVPCGVLWPPARKAAGGGPGPGEETPPSAAAAALREVGELVRADPSTPASAGAAAWRLLGELKPGPRTIHDAPDAVGPVPRTTTSGVRAPCEQAPASVGAA